MFIVIQVLERRVYFLGVLFCLVFSIHAQNLLSDYSVDWGDKGYHFNVVNVKHLGLNKLESPIYISNYLKLSKGSKLLTYKFDHDEDSEVIRFIHKINGHTDTWK